MNLLHHLQLRRWRASLVVLCFAIVVAQTIGLAHQSDLTNHTDQTTCQICQATGHAAAPPAQAKLANAPDAFGFVVRYTHVAVANVRPAFAPQAPRAPPTFL